FLDSWRRSRNTPFPYNPHPIDDPAEVRRSLALRPDAPLMAVFPNAAWDLAALDRDVGFSSMFDWLFAVVEAAGRPPERDVVVRAHPAESRVPVDLQTHTPVADVLRARRAPLPPNVRLIGGDSAISSYVLAQMAQIAQVYSTRFGLELALSGRRAWIAGDV